MIRAALKTEASQLSEITMRSKAWWGYSAELMEAFRDELTILPGELIKNGSAYRVMVRESMIAGFYGLVRIDSETVALADLFVEPDFIGTGVGRALLADAKALGVSTGFHVMRIQSDPNAASFYSAAGARLVGQRESGSIPGRFLPLFEITL